LKDKAFSPSKTKTHRLSSAAKWDFASNLWKWLGAELGTPKHSAFAFDAATSVRQE
jgi:hypothetical protein